MKTRLYRPSPTVLRRLASALRRGELVAMPTETVYGLAANAFNARACRRIFTAKQRPADDPLIVHVTGIADAERLAIWNTTARTLAAALWPGPLTLVLPKSKLVPAIVTSGQSTVALRSPAHPLARRLLELSGLPLAAPSANPFGYVSPTTAEHVLQGLDGRIPHVLDGGPCSVGVESTIVDATNPHRLVILRPGSISAKDILHALRESAPAVQVSAKTRKRVLAPGLLDQHYSPHTSLKLVATAPKRLPADWAVIYWRAHKATGGAQHVFTLTKRGTAKEAAHSLYAVLRAADAGGFKALICEKAPVGSGALGKTINDRLKRAAAKRPSH